MSAQSIITAVVIACLFAGFILVLVIQVAMVKYLESEGICITPQVHQRALIEKCTI